MAIVLTITVDDVSGAPIKGCTVRLYRGGVRHQEFAGPKGNDFSAGSGDPLLSIPWTVTVTHKDFFPEQVEINPASATSTNPISMVTVSSPSAGDTAVAARLVLLRVSAASPVPFKNLTELQNLAEAPRGVLLNENKQNPGEFDYRALFNGNRSSFRRLLHPILADPDDGGWGRFRHETVSNLDPSAEGNFRWLEYQHGRKRYAVAIWMPSSYFQSGTRKSLDFLIFYSPTTAEKKEYALNRGHRYPYGLRKDAVGIGQPYIASLGQSYLFNGHFLCYQLLAAKKKAILLMPINDAGDWGPFSDCADAYRFINEIAHHAHKHGLLEPPNIDPKAPKKYVPISRRQMPVPGIGMVAVVAFSSGIKAVTDLYNSRNQRTPHAESFNNAWKELWDIDLDLKGGFPEWESNFVTWLLEKPDRQLRMYHTQGRAGNWRPNTGTLRSKLGALPVVERIGKSPGVVAQELHGSKENWSAVYFSTEYLIAANNDVGSPAFRKPKDINSMKEKERETHQFIVDIALGHAALLSSFETLRG